jgi:geranylgeranyl transferase type-2 subunit beta
MALVAGPGRGGGTQDSVLPEELTIYVDKHVQYIQALDTRKDEYEYWLTEHLRLNGLYWGLTSLYLLGHPDALPRADVLDFVFSCLHESGGFGAAPGHDAHMLYTVSGVQILATLDAFGDLEKRVPGGKEKIGQCKSILTTATHLGLWQCRLFDLPVDDHPNGKAPCSCL